MTPIMRLFCGGFLLMTSCFGGVAAQQPFFLSHLLGEEFNDVEMSVMHEHANGLLWFGASTGLFSYDGVDFKFFPRPDSVVHFKVTAIGHDWQKTLWVGYDDGSIFWLDRSRTLKKWEPEEGTPRHAITGFAFAKDSSMWFSTYGEGIYRYKNKRLLNFNTDDGLSGDDIYALTLAPNGDVWLGTDQGISICNYVGGKKNIRYLTAEDGLPDEIIHEIIPDQNGNFWIGTYEKGVCFYDAKTNQITAPLPTWKNGVIHALELFQDLELWIGTENNGVWRYSFSTHQLTAVPVSSRLNGAKIYDLHKDAEGDIWVLNKGREIYSANRQFEQVKNELLNIQAVFVDHRQRLWVGTAEGLYLHRVAENGESEFIRHLKNRKFNVTSIFEDPHHNLWIGTFGSGVVCYHAETGAIRQFTTKDGLSDANVFSIAGIKNKIWLGTLAGALEIDVSKDPLKNGIPQDRVFNRSNGLGANFIYKIFIDRKERVWFGTDGKGISVLENDKITAYDTVGVTALNTVYSITEDRRGHIWLSSAKQGVFEFDGVKFQNLALPEGIRDLTITSLVSDDKGNILMVHRSGIDLLDPVHHHLTYYDQEIGVKDIDPSLNAACADRFGNIWVGTQRGLVRYTALRENLEIHPRTLINAVSVYLEPFNFLQKNVFKHDQNYLTFDCIGLWYTDPSTVEYRYKLENYDFDWKISRDRVISYPHLPPGKYVFKIQSTENRAFVKEPITTYAFVIKPPFWRRWWFISGVILSAIALFYWYIKLRDQRIQSETLLKKESIESQFEALKSQINPHFLFNSFNTLISIIEENPKNAVEYVEHLSDFYRSIMQYREKDIIPLDEEIEIVRSFIYLLKQRYGDNLKLVVNLDGKAGYVVPLTLQMLVENAIKHNVISKTKSLRIGIIIRDDYVFVENNLQLKIRPEPSTRFGLQSIAKRYELLSDKKIIIQQTDSVFKVGIPLIKDGN